MSETAEIAKLVKDVQPVVDYVNEERRKQAQAQSDTEVKDILGFFAEVDGLKKMPKKLQRGFLEAHAQETPDFKTAFDNRAKNPKAWGTAREAARDAFTELVSRLPGSTVRTDVGGPSPEQLMKMTPWEWREYLDEKHDR